jgi:hypothetical protein
MLIPVSTTCLPPTAERIDCCDAASSVVLKEKLQSLHDELVERSYLFDSLGQAEASDQLNEVASRLRALIANDDST